MTALPTLAGGNNANAFGINDRSQIVGFSENNVHDPTCAPGTASQVFRFGAVIWEPGGEIRELQPLKSKGDTVAFAFGINDNGEAVGGSGLCSNTSLPPVNPAAPHAVRWEKDGSPTDLGSLGGDYHLASSINNRGDVVGGARSPKDGVIHGFLWTKNAGMQDLGAFPGAIVTVPPCCRTINDKGDIVGFALDGTTFAQTALIWQDNKPVDLNTLIPANSGWTLQSASSINNAGEIVGAGLIYGETHAFLARPK